MTTLITAIRRHPWTLVLTTLGFLVGYHTLLALLVVLRFGEWPNYATQHDLVHNLGLIFAGTGNWRDLLPLLYQEPWLEFGYRNPDYYDIAEWSYLIMPTRLLLVTLTGLSLGASVVLQRLARAGHAGRTCLVASGGGALLLGLGTASLTWIVCCAYPSWVVLLAMLGLGTNLALALQPLGLGLALSGLALQWLALGYQIHNHFQSPRAL